MVYGLWFMVQGLVTKVEVWWCLGFRVQGSGFRVEAWRAERSCAPAMCSGSEEGSYLRLIDFCATHL